MEIHKKILMYTLLIFFSIVLFFPIFYSFCTSFMGNSEILTGKIIPKNFKVDNFSYVLTKTPLKIYFINSLIISTLGTIFELIINSLAAFTLVFINFRWKKLLFSIVIISLFIPNDAIFISNFITVLNLGILNTKLAVMITSLTSGLGIFLMVQHFKALPISLIEAAKMDGANYFYIYSKIVIPLSKTILISCGLFTFLKFWNFYLWPLMVTTKTESRTVQIGLKMLLGDDMIDWGKLMAGVVLILLPSLLLLLGGQKYLKENVVSGAVKE